MFELISGGRPQVPRRDAMPMLVSSAVHVLVIGAIAAVPLLYMSAALPEVPDVMAFVVTAHPAATPTTAGTSSGGQEGGHAGESAAHERRTRGADSSARRNQSTRALILKRRLMTVFWGASKAACLGASPEVWSADSSVEDHPASSASAVTPAGCATCACSRRSGDRYQQALLSRVAPEYPSIAVNAKVQGVVILEAIVDRQGRVEHVKVLRSVTLLDAAAIAAVRRWRYSPLLLNGKAERFVLTVSVSFSLDT